MQGLSAMLAHVLMYTHAHPCTPHSPGPTQTEAHPGKRTSMLHCEHRPVFTLKHLFIPNTRVLQLAPVSHSQLQTPMEHICIIYNMYPKRSPFTPMHTFSVNTHTCSLHTHRGHTHYIHLGHRRARENGCPFSPVRYQEHLDTTDRSSQRLKLRCGGAPLSEPAQELAAVSPGTGCVPGPGTAALWVRTWHLPRRGLSSLFIHSFLSVSSINEDRTPQACVAQI